LNRKLKFFSAGLIMGFFLGLCAEHFVSTTQAFTLDPTKNKGNQGRSAYPGLTVPRSDTPAPAQPRTQQYQNRTAQPQNRAISTPQNPVDMIRSFGTYDRAAVANHYRANSIFNGKQLDLNMNHVGDQVLIEVMKQNMKPANTAEMARKHRTRMRNIRNQAAGNFYNNLPRIDELEEGEWMQWDVAGMNEQILRGLRNNKGERLYGASLQKVAREMENKLVNFKGYIDLRLNRMDIETLAEFDLSGKSPKDFEAENNQYKKAGKMIDQTLANLRQKYGDVMRADQNQLQRMQRQR